MTSSNLQHFNQPSSPTSQDSFPPTPILHIQSHPLHQSSPLIRTLWIFPTKFQSMKDLEEEVESHRLSEDARFRALEQERRLDEWQARIWEEAAEREAWQRDWEQRMAELESRIPPPRSPEEIARDAEYATEFDSLISELQRSRQ
ncbi:hypothetical protein P7C70_g1559, partial [Phenoliferia sp. Uapishka_3]